MSSFHETCRLLMCSLLQTLSKKVWRSMRWRTRFWIACLAR
jgi:hypothetical protein